MHLSPVKVFPVECPRISLKNGPKMAQKWTKNGPKMDPQFLLIYFKISVWLIVELKENIYHIPKGMCSVVLPQPSRTCNSLRESCMYCEHIFFEEDVFTVYGSP